MRSIGFIIFIVGAVLIAFFGGCAYFTASSVQSRGVDYETRLNAQYSSNQNMLSEYVDGFYEQIQVGNLKSDRMDSLLTHAVEGRYGDSGFQAGGAFYAAVQEAYPDLDLSQYDKIIEYIQAKRQEFRGYQDKLLDQIRSYDNWRHSGLIKPAFVSFLGFPSDNLEARVGRNVYQGQEALDYMKRIVTASQVQQSYETGTMDPLQVP